MFSLSYLDDSRIAALHEGVDREVVHPVLSDDLGSRLMRLERVHEHQRHIHAVSAVQVLNLET